MLSEFPLLTIFMDNLPSPPNSLPGATRFRSVSAEPRFQNSTGSSRLEWRCALGYTSEVCR